MHLDEKKTKGTLSDPEAEFDAIISSGKYVIYFAKFMFRNDFNLRKIGLFNVGFYDSSN